MPRDHQPPPQPTNNQQPPSTTITANNHHPPPPTTANQQPTTINTITANNNQQPTTNNRQKTTTIHVLDHRQPTTNNQHPTPPSTIQQHHHPPSTTTQRKRACFNVHAIVQTRGMCLPNASQNVPLGALTDWPVVVTPLVAATPPAVDPPFAMAFTFASALVAAHKGSVRWTYQVRDVCEREATKATPCQPADAGPDNVTCTDPRAILHTEKLRGGEPSWLV